MPIDEADWESVAFERRVASDREVIDSQVNLEGKWLDMDVPIPQVCVLILCNQTFIVTLHTSKCSDTV